MHTHTYIYARMYVLQIKKNEHFGVPLCIDLKSKAKIIKVKKKLCKIKSNNPTILQILLLSLPLSVFTIRQFLQPLPLSLSLSFYPSLSLVLVSIDK